MQSAGLAALDLFGTCGLLVLGRGLGRTGVCQKLKLGAGHVEGAEAGGPEEDDRVLNALAAEARHRFLILSDDAEHAAIGRVEKFTVFVGERGRFQFFRSFHGLCFIHFFICVYIFCRLLYFC